MNGGMALRRTGSASWKRERRRLSASSARRSSACARPTTCRSSELAEQSGGREVDHQPDRAQRDQPHARHHLAAVPGPRRVDRPRARDADEEPFSTAPRAATPRSSSPTTAGCGSPSSAGSRRSSGCNGTTSPPTPGGALESDAHQRGSVECLSVLEGEWEVEAGDEVQRAGRRANPALSLRPAAHRALRRARRRARHHGLHSQGGGDGMRASGRRRGSALNRARKRDRSRNKRPRVPLRSGDARRARARALPAHPEPQHGRRPRAGRHRASRHGRDRSRHGGRGQGARPSGDLARPARDAARAPTTSSTWSATTSSGFLACSRRPAPSHHPRPRSPDCRGERVRQAP
jgi:hypothetical protein